MPSLKIVSINATHSCEYRELRYRTDSEHLRAIKLCRDCGMPLYVTPHPDDSYLRKYFIAQTLDADGYIIPGDYETETPELGKVMYSIWTEHSDYYKSLFPPTKPKSTFWQRNKDAIKMAGWSMLTVSICCIVNNIIEHFGVNYDVYPIVVGYLFGTLAVKNERIKKLKERI